MSFGLAVLNGRRVALRFSREPVCNALLDWVAHSLEHAGGQVDYRNEEVTFGLSTNGWGDYRAVIYVPLMVSGPDAGKRDERFPRAEYSAKMSAGPYPIEYYGGILVQMLCDYVGENL